MTTTQMDRFVNWTLDHDGDLYGRDERERMRWYEGLTVAGQVQAITVPWAAAVLVVVLGEPAVVPLAVVLAALLIPLAIGSIWVQSRRVDTTPRTWTPKRLLVSTLTGLPYVVFVIAAFHHLSAPDADAWIAPTIGAVIGLAAGAVIQGVQTRKRRRLDAVLVADED